MKDVFLEVPSAKCQVPSARRELGFTLVELSIVIVIIGLVIGGVVGGMSLIKQSKLQAVIAEYKQYDAALNAFKLEYGELAGDMSSAWNYWGATCASTANNCNGNGNGKSLELEHEASKLWKHLQLAGMISGNFSTSGEQVVNVNIPASKYPKGGWYMNRYDWWSDQLDSAIKKRHRWNLGAKRTNYYYHAPLFLPKESYAIDLKIDDGIPYLGTVVSHGGYQDVVGVNPNCVVGSGQTAIYNAAYESAVSCNMMFSTSVFSF